VSVQVSALSLRLEAAQLLLSSEDVQQLAQELLDVAAKETTVCVTIFTAAPEGFPWWLVGGEDGYQPHDVAAAPKPRRRRRTRAEMEAIAS